MKAKLSQEQINQLDDLIAQTILPALQEDICIPNINFIDKTSDVYDEIYNEHSSMLFVEAVNYIKNNLY